jgi:Na+/proline symporter
LLLRWFWWRMNGWSEIAAMVTAAIVSIFLQFVVKWKSSDPMQFAYLMLTTVGVTTAVWLLVTLMTRPEPQETLVDFYRQVRPEGPGWRHIARAAGALESHEMGGLTAQFANWILGCILIYASLFGIGAIIFKDWLSGSLYLLAALIAAVLISRNLSRIEWKPVPAEAPDSLPPGLGIGGSESIREDKSVAQSSD